MAVADTLRGIITADASGVEKAVSDADQELDSLSDRAEATGRRMQSAGRSMTLGISAPLAAMGGMAVRQSARFDQAMQQSVAVMGDVDEAMREDLEATAREVAKTTTRSHEEAADSYYFLASAGLDAAEAMEAMPQVAAFAEAGQMDMANATDVATNVMSAYNIEAENMSRVTDVMTNTVTNHNQTMEGMSAAFQNAAPAAASMGIELDELAALTGRLGDVGIQGAEAGTALNSMMRRFAKRSGEAGTVLDELNIQTTDAQGNLLPLTDIFAQLEEEQLTAAESSALFGQQTAAGNALLDAGADNLGEYQDRINDSEGATRDLAETQRDTLNAELQQTRSQLNDAAITIGADVMPLVSTLAGHVGTLADRFGSLSDRQQSVILAAGALGVVLPPVIWGLGTLVTSAAALSGAFGTLAAINTGALVPSLGAVSAAGFTAQVALGPITVPIWAIIAAIGALVGATAGLWYAWDNNVLGIKDTTEAAFQRVKGWFTSAPAWMLVLIGPLGQLYLAWRENLFGVQDIVGTVFDWIGGKIGWLIDRIESLPGINFGDDDVDVDEGAVETEGEAAGEAYATSFEEASEPDAAAMIPDSGGVDAGEEIKGEMTPAIRSALEDGVDGYVSDPDEIEDAPTAINEELFEAVSSRDGATAETLGVSEAELQALMERFDGRGAGGGSAPSTDLLANTSSGSAPAAGGGGLSAQELKTVLREVFEGLRLDARLETDQRGFEQFIGEIARAELAEAGRGRR